MCSGQAYSRQSIFPESVNHCHQLTPWGALALSRGPRTIAPHLKPESWAEHSHPGREDRGHQFTGATSLSGGDRLCLQLVHLVSTSEVAERPAQCPGLEGRQGSPHEA